MRDEFDCQVGLLGEDWEPCPEGTLRGVADSLRARQAASEAVARRNMLTGVMAVLAIVLGLGIAVREYGQRAVTMDLMPVGDISCRTAQSIIPLLVERQLSSDDIFPVYNHIDVCPQCSRYYIHSFMKRPESEGTLDGPSPETHSPSDSEKLHN